MLRNRVEGLWSKAERDAVSGLLRFCRTRSSEDYARYLQALQAPMGDRNARLAMLRPHPDEAAATQDLCIQQVNVPIFVGRDDRIANRAQRHLRQFVLGIRQFPGGI